MGLFSGIGKARGSRGGEYITPGDYVFLINRCKKERGERNKKDEFFIAELVTMWSKGKGAKPAGSRPSFVVKMTNVEYPELALGNVADFMRGGLASLAEGKGEDYPDLDDIDAWEPHLDEEMAEAICGGDNLLSGTFVYCHAFNHKTKKNTDFTRTSWSVPEDLDQWLSDDSYEGKEIDEDDE